MAPRNVAKAQKARTRASPERPATDAQTHPAPEAAGVLSLVESIG